MKALSILAFALTSSAALAAPQVTQSPDTFELRGTVEVGAPNTEALKNREDGQTVNVLISPILTLADASHATVRKSGSSSILHLELKADGSEKLRDYTKTHPKEKMAVVVNDQLMTTPDISETIDKKFDVTLPSSIDAQRLADAVNTGTKARPTVGAPTAAPKVN